MLLILMSVFIVFLLLGMPVSFSLGLAALAAAAYEGFPFFIIVRKMYAGIDVFVLVAVPLFILAANIMNASGITDRLIRFADLIIGRVRGGLAHTNVLASMLFAGISGTALADAAALGSVEIRMMEKEGYDKSFAAALTAASAVVGPIIPPSIMMIIYAIIAGDVSIISMFVAGIVPGTLIGLSLMGVIAVLASRRGFPKRTERIPFRVAIRICLNGLVAIVMPGIILGGILGGVFTPTEASAAAVFYAFIVGLVVTGELKLSAMPQILLETFVMTAAIFFIISTATIVGYMFTVERVSDVVASGIMSITDSRWVFLVLTMVFFLVLGAIMEPVAGMILAIPIFAPLASRFGIDPLHFGILVVVNLSIGCITPPVGTSLYAVATVARLKVETVARALLPFLAVEIAVLYLLVFVPELTLAFPRLFGLR
jgi:C4-dicarboxylate transporter DctM subunit